LLLTLGIIQLILAFVSIFVLRNKDRVNWNYLKVYFLFTLLFLSSFFLDLSFDSKNLKLFYFPLMPMLIGAYFLYTTYLYTFKAK